MTGLRSAGNVAMSLRTGSGSSLIGAAATSGAVAGDDMLIKDGGDPYPCARSAEAARDQSPPCSSSV
jgi:hypothetical protein